MCLKNNFQNTSQHSFPLRKSIVLDAKGRNTYKWEITALKIKTKLSHYTIKLKQGQLFNANSSVFNALLLNLVT